MLQLLTALACTVRDTRAAADLGAKVEDVAETLRDAHATISGWCSRPANSLRVLLQMVSSNQYQEEFVELHQRLSTSYNDLGLALTLHQVRLCVLRGKHAWVLYGWRMQIRF